MSKEYESAGVSLEAGYESVRRIKKHIASTSRPGVMGNIGSFGGMFDLASLGYKEPVLVSGTPCFAISTTTASSHLPTRATTPTLQLTCWMRSRSSSQTSRLTSLKV